MKKLTYITYLLLFLPLIFFGQKKSNVVLGLESNSQYYTDDSKTGEFKESNRFRSNNYISALYEYKNFYAGLQIESYSPQSLLNYYSGFEKTNLGLYYAGYKNNKIEITLGHFYEQFGSGLALRSWEDRQLGINNALRGGRIKYTPFDYLEFKALYGKHRAGFEHSKGTVFGFDINILISDLINLKSTDLSLGFSYVSKNEKNDTSSNLVSDMTNVFEGRIDFSKKNFYSSIHYTHKGKEPIFFLRDVKAVKTGSAYTLNLGYTQKGLGIDATFRRLENMDFYAERSKKGNDFSQYIVNYVPGLTKQHDYLLSNIYVYQAQPQVSFFLPPRFGEIGGQLDIFYNIKKKTFLGGKYGTKIAANVAYWYGLKGEADHSNPTLYDYTVSTFGFGDKYFSDMSIEIRKKWSKKWNSIFYYVNQFYNMEYLEQKPGVVNADIAVAETTYKIGGGASIRFEAQHLWTKDDKKNWIGGTLEYNLSPYISFYVNDIYNYGNDDLSKRIHYYNVGGNYTYKSNRIGLSYGRQRGGLICIGGVCRFVPESSGLTINLSINF